MKCFLSYHYMHMVVLNISHLIRLSGLMMEIMQCDEWLGVCNDSKYLCDLSGTNPVKVMCDLRDESVLSLWRRRSAGVGGLFVRFEPPCSLNILGSRLHLGSVKVFSLGLSETGGSPCGYACHIQSVDSEIRSACVLITEKPMMELG